MKPEMRIETNGMSEDCATRSSKPLDAGEEQQHADHVAERITQLGGEPLPTDQLV